MKKLCIAAVCLLLTTFGMAEASRLGPHGMGVASTATQMITSITGCSSASFTGATAGQTVCTPTVNLFPSTPAFSGTGTLTLTGTQTPSGNDASSFAIVGGAIQTSGCTGTVTCNPGQYNIKIVATGPYSNSGYSQAVTVQANGTGTGGAGWVEVDGGQEFGSACPNSMINCRQIQGITSITYATTHGGVGQVVLPTAISPTPAAKMTSVSIAGLTAGSCSGGTGLNGQTFFTVTDVTDAQHFNIYMPGMCGSAGQTFGVGSATLGSGFWASVSPNGLFNNENGHGGYNPALCSVSGGNLQANTANANWTDPNGTVWTYQACSLYSYQWNLSSGQNPLVPTQTQEMYVDSYFKTAGGTGGGKGMHQTIPSFSAPIVWSNGPEDDTAEQFGNTASPSGFNDGAIWGGTSFSSCAFGSGDPGSQFQQVGSDITLSLASYYFNGSFGCSNNTNLPAATQWFVNWDNDIDDGNSGAPDGSTGWGVPAQIQYFRLYNKVTSGACYTSIPGHATIPHTGTCATSPSYVGPCDVITGGCGEAYSMARAMTNTYSGPLFQVALYSSPSTTMNVPQNVSTHQVDMTGVSTFCGGTYSNCAISIIYAQIQGHSNDAYANFLCCGPANEPANCGNLNGNGPLDCACPLSIDPVNGNPYAPFSTAGIECQYTLTNDQPAVGMTGGTSSLTEFITGKSAPIGFNDLNCGAISLGHCYTCGDTPGALLSTGITWGSSSSYVSCPVLGGTTQTFCQVWDIEGGNTGTVSLGTSPLYGVVMFQWDSGANTLGGFTNGHAMFPSPITPPFTMDFSTGVSVHLGGGGDLCVNGQSFNFFEAMMTNTAVSSSDYNAVLSNTEAAYPSISFP